MNIPETTTIKDFAYPETHPLRYNCPTIDEEEVCYDYIQEVDDMEINQQAIALFDFTPENDNEVALTEGQVIWISYRHGQGWLVAEDPETGENGLVPEEYVDIINKEVVAEDEWVDTDDGVDTDGVDTDDEVEGVEESIGKLSVGTNT